MIRASSSSRLARWPWPGSSATCASNVPPARAWSLCSLAPTSISIACRLSCGARGGLFPGVIDHLGRAISEPWLDITQPIAVQRSAPPGSVAEPRWEIIHRPETRMTLAAIAVTQALLLGFVLLTTKRGYRPANRLLAALVLTMGALIGVATSVRSPYVAWVPHLVRVNHPLDFLPGPLLFLYVRA